MRHARCRAPGCENEATVEVRLYDVYLQEEEELIFDEQDDTCPFLCGPHVRENEMNAVGERKPRGSVRYRYSNRHGAQGFTIYRSLGTGDR